MVVQPKLNRVVALNYLKGRRLRLFGGPNGSGKSTIFRLVDQNYDIGHYINPDIIERDLKTVGYISLNKFGINLSDSDRFDRFVRSHSLTSKARSQGFEISVFGSGTRIMCDKFKTLSYEAALIADFLRDELISRGSKMTFESVMSHPSKIDILQTAKSSGYKTYLYFICTSSPEINIERVKLRIKEGGHAVDKDRIEDRYYKSLRLLKSAVSNTYRAFIWDNSGKQPELILEVFEGKDVTFKSNSVPVWVSEYLLN